VKVTLDESISKVVPVKAYIVGAPEGGYKMESFTVEPPSVAVQGAKAEVSRLFLLRTEPVRDGYLSPEIEIRGFSAFKRVCAICCDYKECLERTAFS
jgi:hypothetical protein